MFQGFGLEVHYCIQMGRVSKVFGGVYMLQRGTRHAYQCLSPVQKVWLHVPNNLHQDLKYQLSSKSIKILGLQQIQGGKRCV